MDKHEGEVDGPLGGDYDTTSKLYTLESIPGKGRVLVAARDICEGTRIIAEKPLMKLPGELWLGRPEQEIAKFIATRLRLLSRDEQRAWLSLCNNFSGKFHPFVGIFRTNAFSARNDQQSEFRLFLEISRINHACRPNCQHTWNKTIGQETVHAIRCIWKGEELSLNYGCSGTFDARRQYLKKGFAFECNCELCNLPEVERAISDARWSEIGDLETLIESYESTFPRVSFFVSNPDECLEDVYSLLTLMQAANITDYRISRPYCAAFKIAIAAGDQARAKVFAKRAYNLKLCCYGNDHPETTLLKSLEAQPAVHPLFGLSTQWALPVTAIPNTLEGEKFDAWLWKRGDNSRSGRGHFHKVRGRLLSRLLFNEDPVGFCSDIFNLDLD